MPNWCSNTVQFDGKPSQLEKIQRLFEGLEKKEQLENCGQLPDFIKADSGYFFNTRWEEGTLYYETRWSPNSDILVSIADKFTVNFTHDFEEPGNLIFGRIEYRDKLITLVELDSNDFDLYEYDEENDNWIFEGQIYESDYEIKEILLERKLKDS